MSVRVQCILSDEEYARLEKIVAAKGISISKYIKDRILVPADDEDGETSVGSGEFERLWQEFLQRLEKFPKGVEFNVSVVFTQGRWETLSRSSKLSIAKLFNRKVVSGDIENVRLIGRSPSNVSLYEKI